MNTTKRKILDTSRVLFNEQSFSQVTIRMIAQKLNISSGNLNYHYKKREDILETLYFEMVAEFDQRIDNLPTIEISILQIKNDIYSSMKKMLAYQFFWTDIHNLLKLNKNIKSHFKEVYNQRIKGNVFLFNKLQEQQLMLNASFETEYDFLAERMVNFGNTWLFSAELYENKINAKNLNHQVLTMLTILHPYLTNQGKKELENLLPKN